MLLVFATVTRTYLHKMLLLARCLKDKVYREVLFGSLAYQLVLICEHESPIHGSGVLFRNPRMRA